MELNADLSSHHFSASVQDTGGLTATVMHSQPSCHSQARWQLGYSCSCGHESLTSPRCSARWLGPRTQPSQSQNTTFGGTSWASFPFAFSIFLLPPLAASSSLSLVNIFNCWYGSCLLVQVQASPPSIQCPGHQWGDILTSVLVALLCPQCPCMLSAHAASPILQAGLT